MITQTLFSRNLLPAKMSQHAIFKSQQYIGWSVNYHILEIRMISQTIGQKNLHFYGILNFKKTNILEFAVLVKAKIQ